MTLPCSPAHPAAGNGTTNIVVLDALDSRRPFWQEFEQQFRRRITELSERPVAIYGESLNLAQFPGPDYVSDYEDWLRRKYADKRIDAVIASAAVPLELLLRYRDEMWSDAPTILVPFTPEMLATMPSEPMLTALLWEPELRKTLATAKALFPGTQRVFLIGGERFGDPVGGIIRREIRAFPGDLRLIESQSSTVEDLRREVAGLDDDTIIFFSGIYRDANNAGLVARDVLDRLAGAASRPIFALSTTYLGHGVVGGVMIDPGDYGDATADTLMQMLAEPTKAILPAAPRQDQPVTLDYRQLQRWGVEDGLVPPGATVRFRPPGIWDAYREQVILGLAALLLLSGVLVVLLAERGRRRRAEQSMRKLSADLLVSQEDERRRIAHELHDGVNQRVALLAIGLDGAAASSGAEEGRAGLLRGLADEVRDVGSEIHAIARGLTPPQLAAMGLAAALEELASGTTGRTGITITVEEQGWPPNVPETMTIVLYRIAQESLQNIVKHSGATVARITIAANEHALSLRVSDNGRGIKPHNPRPPANIGLTSMQERMNTIGGKLNIQSSKWGTSIIARIPLSVAAAAAAEANEP